MPQQLDILHLIFSLDSLTFTPCQLHLFFCMFSLSDCPRSWPYSGACIASVTFWISPASGISLVALLYNIGYKPTPYAAPRCVFLALLMPMSPFRLSILPLFNKCHIYIYISSSLLTKTVLHLLPVLVFTCHVRFGSIKISFLQTAAPLHSKESQRQRHSQTQYFICGMPPTFAGSLRANIRPAT